MKTPCRRHFSPGFTTAEISVAIAVAFIVLGIAIPNLLSWLPSYRLAAGARQVSADLQLTRVKAISQNARFRINFGTIPASSYSIEKDNSGFSIESGPFSLPEGITVTAVSAASEFEPRGTVNVASEITLQNAGGDTKKVQIAVVGRVKVL